MCFKLCLAQTEYPPNGDVTSLVESVALRAQQQGAALLAFPENLMHPRELTISELALLAEPLDGPFVQAVCAIAKQHSLSIVFTTNEINPAGGPPFNTAVLVDSNGAIAGMYRKCHLYDAHGVRESDRMSAGNGLCKPIRTPFCSIGLGICYDLRFPEVARTLALGGSELILFPAAWHDGPNKALHWETLLRARAVENECFVAGVCHGAERYVGKSYVFDPLGNKVACGTDELLTCVIDPKVVRTTRNNMPVFDHRRPELYAQ